MARYLISASENAVLIFDFLREEVDICTPPSGSPDERANWSTMEISQVLIPSSGIETDIHPFPAGCGIDVWNFDAVLNGIRYDFIRSKQFKSLAKMAATARWNVRVAAECDYEGEHRFPYITTEINGPFGIEEWTIKSDPISYGGSMPLYEFDTPVGNVSSLEDDFLAEGCTLQEALAIMNQESRFIPDDEWLYT